MAHYILYIIIMANNTDTTTNNLLLPPCMQMRKLCSGHDGGFSAEGSSTTEVWSVINIFKEEGSNKLSYNIHSYKPKESVGECSVL